MTPARAGDDKVAKGARSETEIRGSRPQSSFVLAFTATQLVDGSALFRWLTSRGIWYVPRANKLSVPGTRLLFYETRVGVHGSAVLTDIGPITDSDVVGFDQLGIRNMRYRLFLENITTFVTPVSLVPLIEHLQFIKNKKFWGLALRSTPREIGKHDFQLILEAANKSSG
jgi:hypothetical protein